jgi:hypothetical protein
VLLTWTGRQSAVNCDQLLQGARQRDRSVASPTIASSNRVVGWLQQMDVLRQAIGTAA